MCGNDKAHPWDTKPPLENKQAPSQQKLHLNHATDMWKSYEYECICMCINRNIYIQTNENYICAHLNERMVDMLFSFAPQPWPIPNTPKPRNMIWATKRVTRTQTRTQHQNPLKTNLTRRLRRRKKNIVCRGWAKRTRGKNNNTKPPPEKSVLGPHHN